MCDVFFSKEINYVPLMFSLLLHSLGTAAVDIGSADKQIKKMFKNTKNYFMHAYLCICMFTCAGTCAHVCMYVNARV